MKLKRQNGNAGLAKVAKKIKLRTRGVRISRAQPGVKLDKHGIVKNLPTIK